MEKKDFPDPERFLEYVEAQDASGFFLSDGSFFEFDEFGGWYDEKGFYYNSEGYPDNPPENGN